MEQTIIVFINTDEQKIYLFGKQINIIDFQDSYLLPAFLKDMTVLYVSQLDEVDGNDVIAMINEMQENVEPHGRYVRSKSETYVRVPDAKITFAGPRDAKALDKLGYDIFEKSAYLFQMLLDRKVEILSEEEIKTLRKKMPTESKESSSILLETSVADFKPSDSIFDDPDAINVKDEDGEALTEAEQILKSGVLRRSGE